MKNILAYLAGVIDSDGYIGIKRSTYAMRVTKDSKQPIYSERICVKQVEPQAVELFHATFGGTLTKAKPNARRGRPLHSWQVTDKKAAAVCAALLPYLRIKAEQARNCLALRDAKEASKSERVARKRGHVGSAPRSAQMSESMEAMYVRAKALNKVGV